MAASDNLGKQWVSQQEHDENMGIINSALQDHKKRVGIGLLNLGMQELGRTVDRNTWAGMAKLAATDPNTFHKDVKDIRSAGIARRQRMNTDRNRNQGKNR